MEQVNEYVNFEHPDNLFAKSEKDENDQFPLKVIGKEKITHDVYKITLEFPNPEWIAGLAPSAHFKMHLQIDGKTVTKMYTPISLVNQKGKVVFAIKVYRKNE